MKKSIIIAALALLSPSFAMAIPLEIIGKPLEAYSPMPANGNEVSTKAALREVIPQGWRTLVHKETQLPSAVSWKTGQPWPSVLESMAKKNGLSVTIDWTERRIVIRKDDGTVFSGQKASPTIDDLIIKPSAGEKGKEGSFKPSVASEKTAPAVESSGSSASGVTSEVTSGVTLGVAGEKVASLKESLVVEKSAESSATAVDVPRSNPLGVGLVVAPVKVPSEAAHSLVPHVHTMAVMQASVPESMTETAPEKTVPLSPRHAVAASPLRITPVTMAAVATSPAAHANQTPAPAIQAVEKVVVRAPAPSHAAPAAGPGTSLRATIEELAKRYHVDVVWNAESVDYTGDLQVAGLDLGEDLSLVYSQLGGANSPLQFELYRQSEVLVVSDNFGRKPLIDVVTTTPYSGKLAQRKGTAFNLNAATR